MEFMGKRRKKCSGSDELDAHATLPDLPACDNADPYTIWGSSLGRSAASFYDDYVIEEVPIPWEALPKTVPDHPNWEMLCDCWLMGVPMFVLRLIVSLWQQFAGLPYLHAIEVFAGQGSVSKGLRRRSFLTFSFEIELHRVLGDFLSNLGFSFLLGLCMRLTPGSCIWLVPVCTSWVWLCRAGSRRSKVDPFGCMSLPWVREGTEMAARCTFLMPCVCAC